MSRNAAAAPHEEAIAWLARENEGRLTQEQQAQLEAWLAADPERPALYERVRGAVGAPNRYSAHPELMEMRSAALAALGHRPRRPVWAAAAAAVAVVMLGTGWAALWPDTNPSVSRLEQAAAPLTPALNPNAAIYRTAVGERTSVKLPDGSVAVLNTDSVLKVAYTGRERGVRLVRGQALFQVAHNKRVPFQVYAGDRRITAVGTSFDVRLDDQDVKVVLVEGVVKVARLARPSAPVTQQVTMSAGELLEAGPAAAMTVRPADVAAQTSWQSGQLVFKSATLAEAVAEVNRYTDRPLAIADPAIAGYRVTGVFRTTDPARFAAAVTEVLPVEIETGRNGSLSLREKTAPAG